MARKIFNNIEEILCSFLLVAMCIVAILQVISRYMFRNPFSWTEELCTIMFVWLVFVGASLALKTGGHFAIEIIVEKLPRRFSVPVNILSCLLVIVFSVMLIWFGFRLAVVGLGSITPALEIPRTYPYAAVGIGGVLMLIRSFENLLGLIKKNRTSNGKFKS
ncbi:MAG: TRAP transporter small permease [Planctomycetota bacterium]|jgi:TRAP-type C4-dicarboxylate transport system permease small subunit